MKKRDLIAATVGALLATALAGGIAWAAIPEGGVIQGCYDAGGNLKVVPALPCPKGYTPLAWNQQGQKGDKGEPGTNGINGTDGQDGVSGYEVVEASASIAPGNSETILVACPAGKTVVQGSWARGPQLTAIDEFFTFTGPPLVSGSYHAIVAHEDGVDRFPVTVTALASCIDT